MPSKLYKILLILGIVAVLVAIPAFWLTFSASSDLEVDFLDVGQGDATLIKTPYGQNIIIDGGPDNTVIKRFNRTLEEEFVGLGNYTNNIPTFNKNLTEWLIEYNFKRSHMSLNYETPIKFTKVLPMYPSDTRS